MPRPMGYVTEHGEKQLDVRLDPAQPCFHRQTRVHVPIGCWLRVGAARIRVACVLGILIMHLSGASLQLRMLRRESGPVSTRAPPPVAAVFVIARAFDVASSPSSLARSLPADRVSKLVYGRRAAPRVTPMGLTLVLPQSGVTPE
jgi:hypothetical protein